MLITARMQQAPDQIVDNPLGLDRQEIGVVVQALNQDLATTYTYYHQVKKHHWVVEGPEYMALHKFLDEWAAALLKAGDALAERITALGGYPVSGPAAQEQRSLIAMEDEGVFDLREMLTKDLTDGGKIAVTMREHIHLAAKVGDFGTEQLLKELLLAHEQNVHHLEHFLGEASLTRDLIR